MHFTYKKKIFLYFLIVFTIFTIIIVAVQQNREKMYKSENFKASLNAYAEIIANYVDSHRLIADKRLDSLNNLLPLLPRGLRVSIIDRQGKVLYDNDIDEEETVENHLSRPEIAQALTQSNGTNIRKSETTGIDYYYDARLFNNYFVRVALPYTDQVQNILKADEIFTYFILLLFFTTLISLLYLADRFGKAVSGLNEFIITAEHSQPDYDKIDFPDTELGEIGHKIVDNYKMLKKSKDIFLSAFAIVFMILVNQSRSLYVAAIGAVMLVYLFFLGRSQKDICQHPFHPICKHYFRRTYL